MTLSLLYTQIMNMSSVGSHYDVTVSQDHSEKRAHSSNTLNTPNLAKVIFQSITSTHFP